MDRNTEKRYFREQGLEEGRIEGRAQGIAEGIAQGREEGARVLIGVYQENHMSYEDTITQIANKFGLARKEAGIWVQKYWKSNTP